MKYFSFLPHRSSLALLVFMFLMMLPSASFGQTGPLIPILECVEYDPAVSNDFTAHWSYNNPTSENISQPAGFGLNRFTPNPALRAGQPSTFLPGIRRFVFSTMEFHTVQNHTWFLQDRSVTATINSPRCVAEAFTYQGRLSDNSLSPTAVYQMQFKVFSELAGGSQVGSTVENLNVSVTNGVFTVQINVNEPLAFRGANRFLEISVRRNSGEAYSTLTPRQQITAVPYAIHSQNAAQLNGVNAAQYVLTTDPRLSTTLNITGNGTIGGNLTVGGTLNATFGCRAGFTAIAGGRLCVSAMQAAATFYGANGAIQTCTNMQARVGNSADVMLTFSLSGFNYFAGNQAQGWLADHAGDNIWGTWSTTVLSPDFDGPFLHVLTGGPNGTAPSLPFRCVY